METDILMLVVFVLDCLPLAAHMQGLLLACSLGHPCNITNLSQLEILSKSSTFAQ